MFKHHQQDVTKETTCAMVYGVYRIRGCVTEIVIAGMVLMKETVVLTLLLHHNKPYYKAGFDLLLK